MAEKIFPDFLPILNSVQLKAQNILGKPNSDNSIAIINSISEATNLVLTNKAKAVVTLPISKANLYDAGFKYPGHTEFIAHLCAKYKNCDDEFSVMMLLNDDIKVALVTIHEPILEIPKLLSQ